MLRHYDDIGLLKPASVDKRTNYRYYTDDQLSQLRRIVTLKELGFSLPRIAVLVGETVSTEQLRGMLRLRRSELTAEMATAQERLERVEQLIGKLEQENDMTANALPDSAIVRKRIPAILVAELTAVAAGFGHNNIGPVLQPLFGTLFEAMYANNLEPSGPAIAYYTDNDGGDGVKVHAAFPIKATPPTSVAGLHILTLPELDAVTTIHRGNMENLATSYEGIITWIASHNLATIGFSREVYLDAPTHWDDWVTELQFAVRPRE
jgi:DNA-binding transcriptional MerR regulator